MLYLKFFTYDKHLSKTTILTLESPSADIAVKLTSYPIKTL